MDTNTLNAVIAVCGAFVSVATIVANVFTYRKAQQVSNTVDSTHEEVKRLANGSSEAQDPTIISLPQGAKKK